MERKPKFYFLKEMIYMAKGKFSQPRGTGSEPADDSILEGLSAQLQEELTLEAVIAENTGPIAEPVPEVILQPEPVPEVLPQTGKEVPVVRKKRKTALIWVCVAVLVILIGTGAAFAYLLGFIGDDGLILDDVTIAGIRLGGMTQSEAASAIHGATDTTYTQTDLVITVPDGTLTLSPADTGAQLDAEAAAQAAFDYGRSGTLADRWSARQSGNAYTMDPLSFLTLDQTYIYSLLETYVSGYNSTYTPSSYSFEGEMPELDGEWIDLNAPTQTLLLYLGTTEQYMDLEALYAQVLDAYRANTFTLDASGAMATQIPEDIDLEAIHAQYSSDPISATMDMTTMEIDYYGVYGYTFDLEAAQALLAEAEYGSTVSIPMEYVTPEVTAESLKAMLYRDELSYAETKHSTNKNRTNNLELACAAIDGYVLMPGDTFDYNEVLGERTLEAGYKYAPAYSGGQTVDSVGGGICQVSSTLYYACLLADMEIVERTNHSYVSSYIDYGMDATVSWGGPEFIFRNNTAYPVRIEAEVSDGYVRIRLVGTDLKDYYVVMTYRITSVTSYETIYEEYAPDNAEGYKDGDIVQTPYTGYTVRTYRCKYDKLTDELISEEEEAFSKYKVRDKIVAVVPSEETPAEPTESSAATE